MTETLTLKGQFVALEPLLLEHASELVEAAADGELWSFNFTNVPNAETIDNYINEALLQQQEGAQQAFIVRTLSDAKIVGCTRFYNIDDTHRNRSIGYTWYAKSVQRTAVNSECKYLLLSHAFEQCDCISVAFHTDRLNTVSQAAIARLGAKKEGELRHHRIMPDGRIRDTICFSITNNEWPDVKQKLSESLKQ